MSRVRLVRGGERRVSVTTHHNYLMGLRFLAVRVLKRPELVAGLPKP